MPVSRHRRRASALMIAALTCGLTLSSGATAAMVAAAPPLTWVTTAPDGAVPAGAWNDEFDSATLGADWSILNESPGNWSLTSNPGNLTVTSQPGDTWQNSNTAQNVFLVDVPAGDFTAVTTVKGAVTQDFQGAGLIAMNDLDNYVRAGLSHVSFAPGGPVVIESGVESKAVYNSTFTSRPGSTGETLRLQRVGNIITTSYLVGGAWVQAAQVTVDFTVTRVGLYALAAGSAAPHQAVFDHFSLVSAPGQNIVPSGDFVLGGPTAQPYMSIGANGELSFGPSRPAALTVLTPTAGTDGAVTLKSGDLPIVRTGAALVRGGAGDAPASLRMTDAGGGKVYLRTADSTADTGYVGVDPNGVLTIGTRSAAVKLTVQAAGTGGNTLTVDGDAKSIDISQDLYGLFYEDINYAADGGLYAELVRNRSFEFNSADNGSFNGLTGWQTIDGSAAGAPAVQVVSDNDMLNKNNRYYLNINATGAGDGVRNLGFNSGLPLQQGQKYDASVWARSTVAQDLAVTVTDNAGATVATGAVTVDGSNTWKKLSVTLTASKTTDNGRLSVTTGTAGLVKLDMISLMPQDTWVGPVNGKSPLRKDLAENIAALHPKFLRFPGGCVTNVGTFSGYEESNFTERKRTYQWKETLGPVEERPTNWNFWGYNQSYGIGYLEYFKLAEDMGSTPLPVLSVGANGCGGAGLAEMSNTDPRFQRWVQDTVDLIEFANGDASTTWGAKRIALGHPQPFNLRYIGLGNEENTKTFEANFPAFRDAVKAKYPDIQIISNSGPDSSGTRFDELWEYNRDQKVDLVDEHYYRDPSWFLANTHRYDSYDRNGPKVFLGEYASRGNTLYNALSEAAYMTSLERNSDVVKLASYAPVFANESYVQWNPDMIWFDNDQNWLTPNYHVQNLFMNNVGNEVVPSTLGGAATVSKPLDGGIFLSTWNTAARYDNVKVTSNTDGKVLFSDDFTNASQWQAQRGSWAASNGQYVQSATNVTDARSIVSGAYGKDWKDYTFEVDATKTAGAEGFLVGFAAGGADDYFYWNLGGWGNTRSVLQKADGGGAVEVKALENRSLVTGQTYKVKVEVKGRTINLYLDGQLQMTYTDPVAEKVFQVVTRDKATGDLIVKVVNTDTAALRTTVKVDDAQLAGTATVTEITGNPSATNTKAAPDTIKPTTRTLSGLNSSFTYDFPASSVTFLRLPTTTSSAPSVVSVAPVAVSTAAGVAPVLPGSVKATLSDGSTKDVAVSWAAVEPSMYATPGAVFEVSGTVAGSQVAAKATVTVSDEVAPVVTVTSSPADPNGADGWYTSSVKVAASATDDSGVAPILQVSRDGGKSWDAYSEQSVTDGTTVLQFRAADKAGNVSAIVERTVKVDAVAPLASSSVDAAGRKVTVAATDHDPASGVAFVETRVDGGSWTRTEGASATVTVGAKAATVEYRATDTAGNVSPVGSVAVPPASNPGGQAAVKITSADQPSAEGWYTQNVIVAFTAPAGTAVQYRLDGGSWKSGSSPVTVSTNGAHVIDHRLIKSNVVVEGSQGTVSVKLDKVVPTAAVTRVPSSGVGSPRNPVTVAFTAADALSGVERIEYKLNQGVWAAVEAGAPVTMNTVGDYVVSYRSVDQAGNTSPVKTTTVRITADPATIVKAGASTVTRGGYLTFSLAGYDRFDTVSIKVGDREWGSVFTDVNGTARITVKVPADAATGKTTITATGSDGQPVATTQVTIK